MNQLTTEVVQLFQTTKEQRQAFAIELTEKLNAGVINPLQLHLQVKCMEDMVKQITSNSIYKTAIVDAALQNGKSFEFNHAKFEVKETGVKYDYSKCEDYYLNELHRQLSDLETKIKQRETFLKTVDPKGLVITDEITGETYTVFPPSKSSTTNVAVTLK